MPRLDFDFARRGRRSPVSGFVLLAIGAAALLGAAAPLARVYTADREVRSELAHAERPLSAPAPKKAADPRQLARFNASLQVVRSLDSPWAELLDALETTRPPEVALLAIEPSADKRSIVIAAEARDGDAMVAHLKALREQGLLRDLVLLRHERAQQVPGMPLRYRLQATW